MADTNEENKNYCQDSIDDFEGGHEDWANKIEDDDLELQPTQSDEDGIISSEYGQKLDNDEQKTADESVPDAQTNDMNIINNNDNELDNDLEEEKNESSNQDEQTTADESVPIAKSKLILIKKLLTNIKENNDRLLQLLSDFVSSEEEAAISIGQLSDEKFKPKEEDIVEGRIIEGVFDGENMIGPDGKQYSVPANYASKSKLVEGDILKLTITANGTFIYKQVGPIERNRVIGRLERTNDGNYIAVADGMKWKILTASVTYFKGEPNDEVVILIPKAGESKWAAVENIVKKKDEAVIS